MSNRYIHAAQTLSNSERDAHTVNLRYQSRGRLFRWPAATMRPS